MITQYYIYITFTVTNIFINIFKSEKDGEKRPLHMRSKTLHSATLYSGDGKKNFDRIEELARQLADWAHEIKDGHLIVVFNSFGSEFKRYQQTY